MVVKKIRGKRSFLLTIQFASIKALSSIVGGRGAILSAPVN
jgi:hypothetical protein